MELSKGEKLILSSALEYTLMNEFEQKPISDEVTGELELLAQSEYTNEDISNLSKLFITLMDKIIVDVLDK